MQVPPLHASEKLGTVRLAGPVNVLFAGVVQSTWNLKSCSTFVPKPTTKFGSPAWGGVVPSMSAGSRPPKLEREVGPKHCSDAAAPASILARSKTQTPAPSKLFPLNML